MKHVVSNRLFALLLACIFGNVYGQFSGSGSGTKQDPYIISNAEQLREMQHNLQAHYRLETHIDASETAEWDSKKGFAPVGASSAPFTGVLDGNGFVITRLTIDRPGESGVGLFGVLGEEAEIRNLGLEDVNVIGNTAVGGLAGANGSEGVQGTGAGAFDGGTITGCYVTGAVGLDGTSTVGGVVGANYKGTITNSYSMADIEGVAIVGGLVGYNGGGTITNSYVAGNVMGNLTTAAFIGSNRGGMVTNSYWNKGAAGQSAGATGSDDGITGLTNTEMRSKASFEGWDFDTIWDIEEGNAFPFLRNKQ